MSIIARIGDFVNQHREHLWRGFILICVAWAAYNAGIISARHGATELQQSALLQVRSGAVSQSQETPKKGSGGSTRTDDPRVVASKTSSSKKYHYSWCASGHRIRESNRLWFPSEDAAQAAGYSLAGNCTR